MVVVCEVSGGVRILCIGDLCFGCRGVQFLTGYADKEAEWLQLLETDESFRESTDAAAERASRITDADKEQALKMQHVLDQQNLKMRVRSAFDLYSLDQFALTFKHRAQTNRRACIHNMRNQEGEWEVLVVVPQDKPRQLFIEHDELGNATRFNATRRGAESVPQFLRPRASAPMQ